LNASYFKGNDLLKYDTQHVISVIKVNEDKAEVDEYVRFLINEGQRLIEQQGFTPMG
jgi:ABC-type molybdate transport system substrate-binding protein